MRAAFYDQVGTARVAAASGSKLACLARRHREIAEYGSTNPRHKRLLVVLSSLAGGIDHPPHNSGDVGDGDRQVRLPGELRTVEYLREDGHEPHPDELRIVIQRQTTLLEIEQPRQTRATELVANGRPDQGIERFYSRSGQASGLGFLDKAGGLACDQRAEQRMLVREVLVQRSDTDVCQFGRSVRSQAAMSALLQNASCRFEDRVHGVPRARLQGQFSGACALIGELCCQGTGCE